MTATELKEVVVNLSALNITSLTDLVDSEAKEHCGHVLRSVVLAIEEVMSGMVIYILLKTS